MFGPFGFAPPAHLVVHDATGASAVVEWRDGRMEVVDNPIGVACNWPHLDWHLTNLRNYVNLSLTNPSPISIEGVELSAMGQGPGMFGLPGDSSSPARFVRAAAFTSALRPVATGAELETTALHILNNFDIPWGFVREDDDPKNDDHTLWSTIANLNDQRYVLRTYDNPVPQVDRPGAGRLLRLRARRGRPLRRVGSPLTGAGDHRRCRRPGRRRRPRTTACCPHPGGDLLPGALGGTQAVDPTIASTALVTASRGLGMEGGMIALAASISTLVLAATVISMGLLGDRIGWRRLLTASLLVAVVGDVLAAMAPASGFYLAGRAIAGLGLGGVFAASFAFVRIITPKGRVCRRRSGSTRRPARSCWSP